MSEWFMNWKRRCGTNNSCLIRGNIAKVCLERLREIKKMMLMVGLRVDVWTHKFPNTEQEVYSLDRGVHFVVGNESFAQFRCHHPPLPANRDCFVYSTNSNVFTSLAYAHSVQNEDKMRSFDVPVCLLIRIFHLRYRGMDLDVRKT
jgi:hypothetical protein